MTVDKDCSVAPLKFCEPVYYRWSYSPDSNWKFFAKHDLTALLPKGIQLTVVSGDDGSSVQPVVFSRVHCAARLKQYVHSFWS